jgi:hypothetical protein
LIHKNCDNPTGQVETNQEKRMFEE